MIGIVGGLGVPASAALLLELSAAARRAGSPIQPRVMMYQVPMPYSLEERIVGGRAQLCPELLLEAVDVLSRSGVAALAVACNTAFELAETIAAVSPVPVLWPVSEAVAAVQRVGARRVWVLGTRGLARSHVYSIALRQHGVRAMPTPEAVQLHVDLALREAVVRLDVAGAAECLRMALTELEPIMAKDDLVIQACTDFGGIRLQAPVPVVDSTQELAARLATEWVARQGRLHRAGTP